MTKRSKKVKPPNSNKCVTSKYSHWSGHDYLVSIVLLCGVADLLLGCSGVYAASVMLEAISTVESMYRIVLPELGKTHLELMAQVPEYEIEWDDLMDSLYYVMVVLKGAFILTLAVSISCIAFSMILIVGILKKSRTCCNLWILLHILIFLISGVLIIIEISVDYFEFNGRTWLLLISYGVFRIGVMCGMSSFARKVQQESEYYADQAGETGK